jgi:hypothetical protein
LTDDHGDLAGLDAKTQPVQDLLPIKRFVDID